MTKKQPLDGDVEDLRWKVHDFDDDVRVRVMVNGEIYELKELRDDPGDERGILLVTEDRPGRRERSSEEE